MGLTTDLNWWTPDVWIINSIAPFNKLTWQRHRPSYSRKWYEIHEQINGLYKLQVSESVSFHHKVYIKIYSRFPAGGVFFYLLDNFSFQNFTRLLTAVAKHFQAANFRKKVTSSTSNPTKVPLVQAVQMFGTNPKE